MALSGLDVANIAYRAGFRGQGLVMAIAIAKRESGWNPDAYNGDTSTGDNSIGLMQINMLGTLGPARAQTLRDMGYEVPNEDAARKLLRDPFINMQFAYRLSNNGTDFYHWGGYKGEADNYNTNMDEAAQLASQATGEPVEWTGSTPSNARGPMYVPLGDGSGGTGLDPEYASLRQAEMDAYQAWRSASQGMSPDEALDLDEYYDYVAATNARRMYEVTYNIDPSSNSASDALQDSIDAGDFQLRGGKAAYDRWADKWEKAAGATMDQIAAAHEHNASQLDLAEAAAQTSMPHTLPMRSAETRVAPRYEDALGRWRDFFGVGEEPPLWGPPPATSDPAAGGGDSSANASTGSGVAPVDRAGRGHVDVEDARGGGTTAAPRAQDMSRDIRDIGTGDNVWDWIGGARNRQGQPTLFGVPFRNGWGAAGRGAKDTGQGILGSVLDAFGASGPKSKRRLSKIKNIPWFADGVTDFQGGPAGFGEAGLEFVHIPGQGVMAADQPTIANLPEGTDIIPADELLQFRTIQRLMNEQPDQRKQLAERAARQNDPEIQQKVMESLRRALASNMAVNPGVTPVLEPGQTDLWEGRRALTGIPAFQQIQPQMPQQGGGR